MVVEAFSAIRSRWLGRHTTETRADDALAGLLSISVELVATAPLVRRMGELRSNVTGYDAAYLQVAETFDSPLVTADARQSRIPDLRCEVRLALPEQ